jgi:hypothetical protein
MTEPFGMRDIDFGSFKRNGDAAAGPAILLRDLMIRPA